MDEKGCEEMQLESVITLMTEEGKEIEFLEIALIPLNGRTYAILQPIELLEGMEEGEALVFEVELDGEEPRGFTVVLDDEIIDGVFAIYNESLQEVAFS